MNRDWLTLAFGLVLVGAVVALSLRQNFVSREAGARSPESTATAAGDTTGPVTPAAPAVAETGQPSSAARPATGVVRATSSTPATAAPATAASAPASASASTVTLDVQSDVSGASVFVDREFVGTTPLTLRGLTIGRKQLNVTASGHEGYAVPIELTEGMNRVNVELMKVRLNATLPVVHRHAMGSCQGRLAASPKGLTFEASDKDDAFVLAFADVDEFEVDYLKRNLRVRRRAGKTWNFTHANADALFGFHKDVSKARERLAAAR